MRNDNFWGHYVLLFIAQLVLSNYFVFSPWVMATLLPAMVLCIPLSIGPIGAMAIAFASGLGVDFLAEGVIGLNALAIVPVAFAREKIISAVFGMDLLLRKNAFTFRRNGFVPVALATSIALIIFLIIFVWAEAAGTRSFWFIIGKISASYVISMVFCLLAVRAVAPSNLR